jgi:hypothetical protein
VVEGLFAGGEFDKQVHVAFLSGRVALKRPEDAKTPHAEPPQVVLVTAHPSD